MVAATLGWIKRHWMRGTRDGIETSTCPYAFLERVDPATRGRTEVQRTPTLPQASSLPDFVDTEAACMYSFACDAG